MDILLNIWYLFSALIGCILAFASIILGSFGIVFILSVSIETIKERDWIFFKFIGIFALVSLIICSTTYGINYYVSKSSYIVSEEIPNIQKYEGIGNEKFNNKQTSNFYYFEQGIDNNYIEYKVEQRKAIKHYTDGKIKIIKHHTEYATPFRFFGIVSALQDDEYYDIYISEL